MPALAALRLVLMLCKAATASNCRAAVKAGMRRRSGSNETAVARFATPVCERAGHAMPSPP